MSIDPEILFHRFFRARPDLLRDGYHGKLDLYRVEDALLPVALLRDLQTMINNALLHENTEIRDHVDHDPFHFDYIDSQEANALAFCADGHSFIGITLPLVEQLWRAATLLGASAEVCTLLRMQLSDAEAALMTAAQRIEVVVFRLQLIFVVLHEFSHVVHGHVRRNDDSASVKEVTGGNDGTIERQGLESDADGYAIYFLLANVFDGSQERAHLLGILGQNDTRQDLQDEILLCAFLVAAVAFIFIQPPQTLIPSEIWNRTHPLHAARLGLMMKAGHAWCLQNRPTMASWMMRDRFQRVAQSVAAAIWQPPQSEQWHTQTTFLLSDAGREYYDALELEVVKLVRALRA